MRIQNLKQTVGNSTVLAAVAGCLLVGCIRNSIGADGSGQGPLAGTRPLELEGDIASQLVSGVDRFLLREIDRSVARRSRHWRRQLTSTEAYEKSIAANRTRLAHITGLRDKRVAFSAPQLVASTDRSALIGRGAGYDVFAVRWPAIGDIHAEGLLLMPRATAPLASVVVIPDAGQSPEQLAGLEPGIDPASQFARRLAASGCRVLVPTVISRQQRKRNGRAQLTHREYLYRSAFELGRHLLGYELQKVLAAVDWFERADKQGRLPVGVIGYGEGGLLATLAGAVDPRIGSVCACGSFGTRHGGWREPLDRNIFGLLDQFGDAELATMVFPRTLVIETSRGPQLTLRGQGGAPAVLESPTAEQAQAEYRRAVGLVPDLPLTSQTGVVAGGGDDGNGFGGAAALNRFLAGLGAADRLSKSVDLPKRIVDDFEIDKRMERQVYEIDRHNQWQLRESPFIRSQFMSKQDTSSLDKYEASNVWYRDFFRREVVGEFDHGLSKPQPRTRWVAETDKWVRYEVVLDVFPDVMAYGLLTLPKGIPAGQRRPVVVCQHGLEGRPQDVIGEQGFRHYKAFATTLAERGFITFAPQNLYIFRDRFRTLQRKANLLGKTLFSVIVPQHQQIVDWLQSLPQVDPDRIAFYGLSYGGKSAMRIPALVTDYCLSICSADFNEWVLKNASTRHNFSYVWTGEYEIFEFDLGSTFNYAEMAALIAPRPFMVERGHFDGVGTDNWVAHEFAKVRNLYAARLHIADRCEIEWFVGPHTINGRGTFEFLHKHLKWPSPE
ncbi:MAG: dienelactone hydrolase family protein [Planctomycetaceae bacterium]